MKIDDKVAKVLEVFYITQAKTMKQILKFQKNTWGN